MITDQDVEKLKETFVTKDEFGVLIERVDGIQETLGDLKVEVGGINDRLDSMDGRFDSLEVKFDAMLDLLTDSKQEHAAGAVHLARHDRHIGALATATGVALPE